MHVAITDVTDSRSDLLPPNAVGVRALISRGETAGTNAVKLTSRDVCHLCTFSSVYVDASNTQLVAFVIRRSF